MMHAPACGGAGKKKVMRQVQETGRQSRENRRNEQGGKEQQSGTGLAKQEEQSASSKRKAIVARCCTRRGRLYRGACRVRSRFLSESICPCSSSRWV